MLKKVVIEYQIGSQHYIDAANNERTGDDVKKSFSKVTALAVAFAVASAGIPLSIGAMADKGTNLIAEKNYGFEDGQLGASWMVNKAQETTTVTVTNTDKKSGTYSVLVEGRTNSNDCPQTVVDVKPNTEYYISAWIKPVSSTEKGRGRIKVTPDSGSVVLGNTHVDLRPGQWSKVAVVMTTEASTSKLTIGINTNNATGGNAAFYVDDFEICEITSTTAETVVPGNILANPGFEEGSLNGWRTDMGTGMAVVKSKVDANSGDYVAKSSNRNAASNNPQIFIEDAALDDNTYYYASAMVRQASPSENDIKAIMRLQKTKGETGIDAPGNYTAINEEEFTKIAAVLYNKDATQAKVYVNTNETDETGYVDLWTDDYVLLPITSSVPNGAKDVIPDTDITLTVPEDIEVSTETLSINNDAKITSIDRTGRTCVVHFGDMIYGTQYTLSLNTGLNADPKWEFTTEWKIEDQTANMLESYDPGFENGAINTSKWNLSGKCTTRTDEKAHTGKYSAFSSGRAEVYSGPQAKNVSLTKGEMYYVSAWVYTDATNEKATIRLEGADGGKNNGLALIAKNWTKISRIVEASADTAKIYVVTDGKSDFYVDDFELMIYEPTSLVSSTSLADKKDVSVAEKISLTFTNSIDDTQTLADKFTVSGMTVKAAELSDDLKTVTLTLDSPILKANTKYTVSASGIKDCLGQIIANISFSFETGDYLSLSHDAVFTRSGSSLTTLTPGEVTVTAFVTNDGTQPCAKPIMIVTVYDEAGFIIDVVATEFGETLAENTKAELTKTLTVDSNAKSMTAHILNAANNISYMASPRVLRVAE